MPDKKSITSKILIVANVNMFNLQQKSQRFQNWLKGSSLINSFFVTLLGSGMSKFILVAATFYCTNMLTKAEFGEFSFVRNTLAMILTICANNFSSLCTKFAT